MIIKRRLIRYLLFVSVIAAAGCSSVPPLSTRLQVAMDESRVNSGAIGSSAAILMADGSLWTGVSGMSHNSTPVTPTMLFDIGSVEKNLQATLALMLVKDSVISLDDRLDKWLPAYPNIDGSVTIRQLLNMTSGIDEIVDAPKSPWRIGYRNIQFDHRWTWEEVCSTLVGQPEFQPGERCSYSNTNFILLKMIVEKAMGSTQASAVRRKLLTPYGLNNTIVVDSASLPETVAVAHGWYDIEGDGTPDDIFGNSMAYLTSIAPMIVYSTPTDMVKWIDALYHTRKILPDTLLTAMLTFGGPVQREPLMKGYGLGVVDINLGMFNPRWNAVRMYGHLGSQFGYSAFVGYVPDHGISLAFLFNRGADGKTVQEIVPVFNAVLDVLFEELRIQESSKKDEVSGLLEESRRSPGDVNVLFRLAKAYQVKKEDYEASLIYERILALDPGDVYGHKTESLFWKATYDGVIGKKPENLIAFIAEHKEYKDIRQAYTWLAKTYLRRDEIQKALEVYHTALNVLESDPEFFGEYAWWVYQNKCESDYDTAITYTLKALDMKPEAYYIWDTLAWLYYVKGEHRKAVEASSTALKYAPKNRYTRYEQNLKKIQQGNPGDK